MSHLAKRWIPILSVLAVIAACIGLVVAITDHDTDDLAAVIDDASSVGPERSAPGEIQQVLALNSGSNEFPEGIVIDDDGTAYFTLVAAGEIRQLDPDGTVTTLASIPLRLFEEFLIGLAFDPSGDGLFATVGVPAGDTSNAGVWKIGFDGKTRHWATVPEGAFPDELTLGPDGALYLSDLNGAIWRIDDDGTTTEWIRHDLLVGESQPDLVPFPIGANGLVFNPDGDTLYVTNTTRATVLAIPYRDGQPGTPAVHAEGPELHGGNGVTIAPDGVVYVANSFSDTVVTVSPKGAVRVIVADGDTEATGLQRPANLAWGPGGPGRDLWITSSDFRR